MRRGKLHYNADRWYAYCADRMGWQVGVWIDKFNGNAADAVQASTHPSRVGTDAAAPTPSVWRRGR